MRSHRNRFIDVEWLETDGLGGFASGTVSGLRTRRYHAMLLVATRPPTGRVVLVNGLEVWIETPAGRFALSSHAYASDLVHPDGAQRLEAFAAQPWPHWQFRLEDNTRVDQELFVRHGAPVVVLTWRLHAPQEGVKLSVRPLLSGRDYHALHHENTAYRFDAERRHGQVIWQPYPDLPRIVALSNGTYTHGPDWYRHFFYAEEHGRGLDDTEDLATPGYFSWDLSQGEAVCLFAAASQETPSLPLQGTAEACAQALRQAERQRRQSFSSTLHRAADAYLVRRGTGKTLVAGYPWFTDWGRDTLIALRGLCLATGRLDAARDILLEWAGAVSEGMLPNRFPDRGEHPEFNAVDASLWYVIAVYDFLQAIDQQSRPLAPSDRKTLHEAIDAILRGYARGTRYGIHLDDDGLLAAGEPGVQLTWMDAKVGDWVVTPRLGKPVEVEALWLNALWIARDLSEPWGTLFTRGCEVFRTRFWNETDGYLYDVVDADHRAGDVDPSLRPNQLFAVGGLPLTLLPPERARRVVDTVEAHLWTPMGLRSLAPDAPGYVPRYEGGVHERDGAYHQGTVWPWLIGPFIEAWLRTRGNTRVAKQYARATYLKPLLQHLDAAGLGHISEIADGDPPHTPRGCPFQAWSLGEALRLALVVLADDSSSSPPRPDVAGTP